MRRTWPAYSTGTTTDVTTTAYCTVWVTEPEVQAVEAAGSSSRYRLVNGGTVMITRRKWPAYGTGTTTAITTADYSTAWVKRPEVRAVETAGSSSR